MSEMSAHRKSITGLIRIEGENTQAMKPRKHREINNESTTGKHKFRSGKPARRGAALKMNRKASASLVVLLFHIAAALTFLSHAYAQTSDSRASSMGPLKVSTANSRYFMDGNGRPVYLTGSHTWANLNGRSGVQQIDYPSYLNFLQQHGHNFIRFWAGEFLEQSLPVYRRIGPGVANDGGLKLDLNQFNQAYFDNLRSKALEAQSRGIYVSIMLFSGRSEPGDWRMNFFNGENNINEVDGDPNKDGYGREAYTLSIPAVTAYQEAYVRKVMDTLDDLDNIIYEISNEAQSESAAWQYHMINYVKDYEARKPKQHPVGMTSFYDNSDNNASLFNSPAEWISPGSTVWAPSDPYSANPPAATGRKVKILDNDHTFNNPAGIWAGPKADRVWVWKSFLRGLNPIFMDPIDQSMPNWVMDTNAAATKEILSARKAMGHTRSYSEKINLATMTPQESLSSTGYALANPGFEYLILQPASDASFTVNLVTGNYTYEWFNPSLGVVVATGTFSADGGDRTFTAPFSGDAVLYLRSTAMPLQRSS